MKTLLIILLALMLCTSCAPAPAATPEPAPAQAATPEPTATPDAAVSVNEEADCFLKKAETANGKTMVTLEYVELVPLENLDPAEAEAGYFDTKSLNLPLKTFPIADNAEIEMPDLMDAISVKVSASDLPASFESYLSKFDENLLMNAVIKDGVVTKLTFTYTP